MITIASFLISAIVFSFLVWLLLTGFLAIFAFLGKGDDLIFVPIIPAFCVLLYWLVYSVIIIFIE